MPTILAPLDLQKNELRNCVVQVLATAPASPSQGQFYFDSGTKHLFAYNGTGWEQASGGGGTGTVASVGLAMPAAFTVTGSPVTTSGTLTGAWASQTGNTMLAAPDGATGVPTFRALVANDIPIHTSAKISDFNTAVRSSSLDLMAAPAADVNWNNHKITNLASPAAGGDATNKTYVDNAVQGLAQKPTARVATTAALPANTYANGTSGVGATLTATANGALTVDGVAVAANDTVLVKNEATASHNGLYSVTQPGTASLAFILTRHIDMDTAAEFNGAFVPVDNEGTTNANTLWLANNVAGGVTVGTTSITFVQLNSATAYTPGTGIAIAANVISISATYAGQTSLVTLGTVTTGTWNATAVAVAYGGTGATTAAAARTNLGAKGSYTQTIGDGAATTFAITQATHGLAANGSLLVATYDATTGDRVFPTENVNNTNGTVNLTFATAPAANSYRVVILG